MYPGEEAGGGDDPQDLQQGYAEAGTPHHHPVLGQLSREPERIYSGYGLSIYTVPVPAARVRDLSLIHI